MSNIGFSKSSIQNNMSSRNIPKDI